MEQNVKEFREKQKEMAVKYMKALDIFDDTIKQFEKGNTVSFTNNGNGNFWVDSQMKKEIKAIEEKYNCLVYYGISSYVKIMGDPMHLMTYLVVTKHEGDWEYDLEGIHKKVAYSYTINRTFEEYSEFGAISYDNRYGSLVRVY